MRNVLRLERRISEAAVTNHPKMQADPTVDDLSALCCEAVIWGLPLLTMGHYLDAAKAAGVPFNRLIMNSEVATARSHAVGPNIDTLNGRAWLDLAAGPQVIGVPDTDDRYYSVQLQDMYTNSFAYIGRRTTGTQAGYFVITPPGYAGTLPDGLTEIRATTSMILVFIRTLVRGPDDVAAAQAINAGFSLGPLSAYPGERHAPSIGSNALDAFQPVGRRSSRTLPHEEIAALGTAVFGELNRLGENYPPLPSDAPNLARFAPIGLGAGQSMPRYDNAAVTFTAAVPAGIAAARHGLQTWSENGWSRRPNVDAFILDPLQRAANCVYGPNTQVAVESVFYNKRQGPDGQTLSGANRYRLLFGRGQTPPVDAFWSLTLYDNRYGLFDNPLDRYGITDRLESLRFGADGSLDIRIQATPPDGDSCNWLPCPADEFQLILRTYQPQAAILDRRYRPPPLEIIGAGSV